MAPTQHHGVSRDTVEDVPLRPGLSNTFEAVVTSADTADALGSGDLAVLGTPRVVALAEEATVRTVSGELADSDTTVGIDVSIRHRRASLVGARITVVAHLAEIEERRLTFRVEAYEAGNLIADGIVRRAIVDRSAFMDRAGAQSDT